MRSKLPKTLVVLLGLAFFLLSLDLHADHDSGEKSEASHCCVQCCPSHHPSPLPQTGSISLRPSLPKTYSHRSERAPQDCFRSRIDRPPIA